MPLTLLRKFDPKNIPDAIPEIDWSCRVQHPEASAFWFGLVNVKLVPCYVQRKGSGQSVVYLVVSSTYSIIIIVSDVILTTDL